MRPPSGVDSRARPQPPCQSVKVVNQCPFPWSQLDCAAPLSCITQPICGCDKQGEHGRELNAVGFVKHSGSVAIHANNKPRKA